MTDILLTIHITSEEPEYSSYESGRHKQHPHSHGKSDKQPKNDVGPHRLTLEFGIFECVDLNECIEHGSRAIYESSRVFYIEEVTRRG